MLTIMPCEQPGTNRLSCRNTLSRVAIYHSTSTTDSMLWGLEFQAEAGVRAVSVLHLDRMQSLEDVEPHLPKTASDVALDERGLLGVSSSIQHLSDCSML